ncbi:MULTISPECIES: cyclopropane mycolic acid synthase family methyltransferase [unclassified Mycolicibacterium]|uniref:cyclopropane mycolic acid synthase family methyltransferase n=1 Tax=unclassified Mycolicibacterium TaxID=2636767 RepID=UPI0012DCC992|nr:MULTISPECIES: cyclopropane mycolic acid synthase family methyltransferase [unclassified Mycolicibacterium]MUL83400.1 methyltransferase domain-containing protein [Mycolicibacterium sp. CBMA 329]MUL90391.1 methyltransferase domain-containing protein [Mycolicibacterium sp. CBMA 331]MUM00364.1 methyltransferase domain-containing protein [Mycolicibacterium sp. CBMA 334]MUM29553.1 methyltransferase domain-containing protein [Mycolicibacterium sp. CBMA 295]MUM41335.1 methyltransferase domain-conta
MASLRPRYETLQSIYDISDEFFELFLGPTMGYTCSYFDRAGMSLDEGQNAKFDLALSKLNLQPGMTLLDIGCGWGGGLQRAIENYEVNVIGLTLSRTQRDYAEAKLAKVPNRHRVEVRLQGWEEFDERVDRIVSIGAFEHFGHERYPAFFKMAYNALPGDGSMLLHTICGITQDDAVRLGIPLTLNVARFVKFIMAEIFPGGRLPTTPMVEEHASSAGFKVAGVQPIGQYYPQTLEQWAANLESHRDQAIAVQSQQMYDRYMKYLTGCPDLFRGGYLDVNQFTLQK